MKIVIEIEDTKFPNFDYNQDEARFLLYGLFRKWYDENYTKFIKIDSDEINENIDKIKNEVKNSLTLFSSKLEVSNAKINNFESNLNRINDVTEDLSKTSKELFSLKNTTKKGKIFENSIEDFFKNNFPEYCFINTSESNHKGDAIITSVYNSDCDILVEMKNYSNNLPKQEIKKFKNDLVTNKINYGLFICSSSLQGKKTIDFEIFVHENTEYYITYASDVFGSERKIELALMLLENFIKINKNKKIKNQDILSDEESENREDSYAEDFKKMIIQELEELNSCSNMVLSLRQDFTKLENNIRFGLDSFYVNLRNYESEMNSKIDNILVKTGMCNVCKNIDSSIVLDKYKSNQMYSILTKIYDDYINNNVLGLLEDSGYIKIVKLNDKTNVGHLKIGKTFIDLFIVLTGINIKITKGNYSKIKNLIEISLLNY